MRIEAGRVVLAAGTYGTPAILQRSGVGAPALLRAAGIEPRVDLPGVGRNLHDHPLAEVEFAGSEQLRRLLAESAAVRFTPEEQTLGKLRSSRATGPYDLHVFPVAAQEHSLLAGRVAIAVSAMEPVSRGSLHVTGTDPEEAPRIDHGYLTDPGGADLAVIAEGIARARELAAAEPLRELIGAEITPSLDRPVAEYHAHYFHPGRHVRHGSGDRSARGLRRSRSRSWPRGCRRRRLLADARDPAREHEPAGGARRRVDRRRAPRLRRCAR